MPQRDPSYPHFDTDQHRSFAVRTLRAEYLSQPPKLQAETRDRVRRLLDNRQRQGTQSWLAKYAKEIYGI